MRKNKSKLNKVLAILLSMTMLLTGIPAPIYAESIATPTDAVVEVADEAPVEEETVTPDESPSEEVPDEPVDTPVEDESEPVPDETPEDSTEDAFPENTPADDVPVGDDSTADGDPTEQPEETGNPTVDQPVTDEQPDAEVPTEPQPETPAPSEQPLEDEQQEEIPVEEPDEEAAEYVHPVQAAVDANGHAYLLTQHIVQVYRAPDMQEHIFTIAPNGILLVTAFIEQDGVNILEVHVELNNRLVCFDIKQLGQQLKKLGMLIVQDQVWNRVTINRAMKKTTWYYMDEMHLLLREKQTAAYSIEIWKRFRKWGGIPTGITQNVKDLLISHEVSSIFENSEFVLMLNQAAGDRAELAKRLNISNHQLSHVTQSGEGEGLLFFGNVIIPFVDRFPKNTELYRIMTTKPSEMKQEGVATT